MHRARLVRLPLRWQLPIALLVTIALFAEPRVCAASSITSRILIDPVGEHTGDEFGRSVAWIGDVNGDGYDDILIGAFRYPEIQSHGKAYLYFGGPSLDTTPDLTLIGESTGSLTAFGVSVASAGDVNEDGFDDVIVGAPGTSLSAGTYGSTSCARHKAGARCGRGRRCFDDMNLRDVRGAVRKGGCRCPI